MSEYEKQINEMQKSFAMICDDIAVAIVRGQHQEALDLALQTKRELVADCESNN